uniref:Major facilitator superfamily (MFS) profile domain-containing protein n=1 Tax=Anopheles minimus TaxID=112268 RepID=A0A182WCD6_9DIPT
MLDYSFSALENCVLTEIQDHFNIGDDEGGLLQTAFVLSYMIFAPVFGYLGDRYSRKWIMVLGVSLWSTTTLLGSYMNQFGWFITFRALVGIGEASYSTIAPTIISDLFVGEMRSKMLALFYFAIPVGSGCGYIVGAKMASIMNSWVWSLRVTPVLGAIAVVLIVMLREPQRGQSEGTRHMEATSYKQDIFAIVRNPSFMLSTAGFTCVAFVTGALACVSLHFGIVAMMAGLIGVPLGTFLSNRLRDYYEYADPVICAAGLITSAPFVYVALVVAKYSGSWCFILVFFAEVALNLSWPIVADMLLRLNVKSVKADPYICAFGLILSSPLLVGAIYLVRVNIYATYTLIFFGELALNLNWAIVADILLYVVVPTRRSTAEAFQILISHAFGDAGSPYFVGLLAENTTVGLLESVPDDDPPLIKFRALQYALFSTCFVEVLGGVFFLITAIYIDRDRSRVNAIVLDYQLELSESSASDGNGTDDGQRLPVDPHASSSNAFPASTVAAF